MKNKSLLIASVFVATASTVSAQDLTSKKGEPFLPEAGDWALSVDAVPFLNYFGRMFSNAGATSPTFGYANAIPVSIRGKYFSDATTAFRGGLRLGFGSRKWTNEVVAPAASTAPAIVYPNEAAVVEDEFAASSNDIMLSGGIEMRKGKTRLQGYYGGELILHFWGNKDAYTYGNALSSGAAPDPTITVGSGDQTDWTSINAAFPANIVADPLPSGGNARVTERKNSNMGIGLRGFIGAEYFLFPKISIGAEYGWGFGMMSTKTSVTTESNGLDINGNYTVGTVTKETKSSGWAVDSDIQNNQSWLGGGGQLNLIVHF